MSGVTGSLAIRLSTRTGRPSGRIPLSGRSLEDLRQFGHRVDAKFREVRPGPDDTYRIVAQWFDPGTRKVYAFESDPIGFDPSAFLTATVPVFLDPDDPRRYLVDTSFLPPLGNVPDDPEHPASGT